MSVSLRRLTLLLAMASVIEQRAPASTVVFEFTGTVGSVTSAGAPFNMSLQHGDPVMGRFMYDLATPGIDTSPTCDCREYRSTTVTALNVRIGDSILQTDQIVIGVANDLSQPGGGAADSLAITWLSNLNPPLGAPLIVDGVAYTSGQFRLLLGLDDLLSSAALPMEMHLGARPYSLGFLSDSPSGLAIMVNFSILSVSLAASLPADFDIDGQVSAADFLVWQRSFGAPGGPCDGDDSQLVDGVDLRIWQDEFGKSLVAALGPQSNVPEPGMGPLLVGFFLIAGSRGLKKYD